MHPMIAKTLQHSSKTSGILIPEVPTLLSLRRIFNSCQASVSISDLTVDPNPLKVLLTKELPLLTTVTKWSKYYYNQSSDECKEYYEKHVEVSLDEALDICNKSVRQSCLDWMAERQKRITGTTCYQLYKHCKSMKPNWEKRLHFAYQAKDFPLYLSRAIPHGLSHQKAAQRKYCEKMRESTVLDLGLVVHPKLPFLGFSPDGLVIDRTGKPQGLIEIKCPLDGRCMSSEDLLKLAVYVDEKGLIRSDYKYYSQVQLGMFILGLPYCDFILYSSSENDYTRERIKFDETFVREMMASLVKVYFKEILPWLTRKNLCVHKKIN